MTVSTTSGNLPATTSDQIDTGLEDMDANDFVVPRLKIVTKEGKFQDGLSNELFDQIDAVILGLVKQRIMWHPTVEDDDKPMCKSPDFNLGYPTLDGNPKEKLFPFKQSNFTREHMVVNPVLAGVEVNTNDHPVLPCASCKFKEWDTHPNGKKPWCSETYTLPIAYRAAGSEGEYTTALLTLKSSGITPTKRYLSSFARSKTPAFTAITRIGLTLQTRGDTVYSVPHFARVGDTNRDEWPEYSETFKSVREFVRSAPRPKDADDDDESTPAAPASNPWGAAEAAVAAEQIVDAEIVTANPAAATPTPPTTPMQAPPSTPATPTPAPAPAAPQTPAAATPPPAPVAPVPPAPNPTAPAPVAQADDDDDLPF